MRGRVAGCLLAAILTITTLSGCEWPAETTERYRQEQIRTNIELGKECASAGGTWKALDKYYYVCEIP